ncbi:MAG TPA: AbrB/MazE/SpoVT family DNA-binding domain-containing protein [Candidatus Xenobia bacterium]|jgi:AbrB family looped-hinge helix DNA binding protein
MKAIVSEKGQVTIPKTLRERLGIRPGQVLDFMDEGGRLVAVKANATDRIQEAYGLLNRHGTTARWIKDLRGEPDAVGE